MVVVVEVEVEVVVVVGVVSAFVFVPSMSCCVTRRAPSVTGRRVDE